VSHGVELVIDKSGKLLSAKLNGNEIDDNKEYRVATIDYLVQGNDGLKAFLKGTNLLDLPDKKHDSRFVIMDYFREKAAQGIVVNAKVEGRIKVN
jgi:2',3'-cyclic-nucleotide 2'-phosphodiesterase (5'-nucleotidase family)